MARWAVFRAACLLATLAAFVAAKPVLMMREAPKHSIQILYGTRPHPDPNDKKKTAYWYMWSVWVGPQGVAVNPCEPGPFSFSRIAWAEGYAKDGGKILYREITDPRYPNEGSWSVVAYPEYIGQKDDPYCVIKGKGEKGPAVLDCGRTKIEFQKDAQFDDEIMKCGDDHYHRAWTVEY